jgi:molybdopterin/thiamine biosynthesis adenylyltransferase
VPDGPDPRAESLYRALLARGQGLLSESLRDRAVLVAGLGSVGSYVADDVGRPKTEALARRLLAISPSARLELRAAAVEALEPGDLDALVRRADLVLAATDDPAAQRTLDRFAYARGRPAIFVGLYEGARGGEVILTAPERSACFLCATRARHALERGSGPVARRADYGTGRLAAESALGADIQHVASAAVKLALSLLQPGGALAALADEAVAAGTTYLTLSTVPRYWFYPELFGDLPGQGAFQSVWLAPVRLPDCPVCGAAAGRVDPLEVPLRAPSREALAALVEGDGPPDEPP